MSSVIVSRTAFVNAISWVSHVLPSRPLQPIAACIRMAVRDGQMTLEAFNFEQSAVASVAVTGDDLTVAVPGRLLADLARSVNADTVTFTVDGDTVTMSSGRAVFTLRSAPVEDFPGLPGLPPVLGTVNGSKFAAAAARVALAAASDATVPTLTGVQVVADPQAATLTFAATDRYRLSTTVISYEPAEGAESQTFLVPARALEGYAKSFAHAEAVTLHQDGGAEASLFGVSAAGRTATTRLVSGDFPKYETLIPSEFSGEINASAADLAAAVKRVALVTDTGKALRFTAASDAPTVITAGDDSQQAAREELDVVLAGEAVSIALNPQYLLDGLAAVGADTVRIQFQSGRRPALFTADDEGNHTRYLVMPING